MNIKLSKVSKICGSIEVPADKSITHRAVILSSLADGVSAIKNYLPSEDCLRTIEICKQLGADIKIDGNNLYIKGYGLKLQKPNSVLYAGNSGTTARLISGILAGQHFKSEIAGDESLSKRDMKRIIEPLSQMGAVFESAKGFLPLSIEGKSPLKAIKYDSDKASAQVKSAVLFAGLYADGITEYREPIKSRDHSERALKSFGADIKIDGNCASINPIEKLNPQNIEICGDLSSAAFFIAASVLIENSELTIKNVGINPSRDGFLRILKTMGADIEFDNIRESSGEPVCDIKARHSKLHSANIDADIVPSMIDEIPIFALLCAKADGISKISGAKELRAKESDRIKSIVGQFKKLGIEIEESEDGFEICGKPDGKFNSCEVESFFDHRIAMTLSIAALAGADDMIIKDAHCAAISFPNFYGVLKEICL